MRWVVKGAILSFGFIIINKFLWYIFRVILANYLGPEAYGTFSYAFALLSIFATIAAFGFPAAMERYIAFHKEEKIKRKFIFFALNFTALLASMILLLLTFTQIFETQVLLFLVALPFTALTNIIAGVLRAHGKIEYQILSSLIYAIINVFFATLAMFFKLNLIFIALGFVLAYATNFLLSFYFFNKVLSFRKAPFDRKIAKKLISFSLPLVTAGILGLVITWTDTLMLNFMKGRITVGIYNAAVPIAKLVLIFALSLNSLLLPEISRRLAEKRNIKKPVEIVYRWNLIFTMAFVLPLLLFPAFAIKTIFSPRYVAAAIPLSILSIGFLFNAISQTTSRILSLFEETNKILLANSFAAFLNIFLNFSLIPAYSMIGAAVASATSLIAQFFILYYFARKKMEFSLGTKYSIPVVIVAILTWALKSYLGILAAVFYASLILAYLWFISRKERDYIFDLIRNVTKIH